MVRNKNMKAFIFEGFYFFIRYEHKFFNNILSNAHFLTTHTNTMIRNFILTVLILINLPQLNAQRPGGGQGGGGNMANAPAIGVIKGKVIDHTGKIPMQYVSVALISLRDSSIAGGTITNDSGKFVINEVKYGRYMLVSTFMGYKRDTVRDIRVTPNNTIIQIPVIALKTGSKDLSEVEIIASRTYVEYKIDKKVVNVGTDISSAGGSAVQALENVPSVTVDIEGNVSLRGSSNFTVLIDGKPSPLSGTQALEQIPVGAIQNIEIITNPSAKYDPDGMSGIVNVVMKKNVVSGINGMIEVNYGSYNTRGLNTLFSYRTKKVNVFAGGDYSYRNNPGTGSGKQEQYYGDTLTFYRENFTERSRMRDGYNVRAGLDYYLDDKNTVSIEGRFGQDSHSDPYTAKSHDYFVPNIADSYKFTESDGVESNTNSNGSFTWDHKFKSQFEKLTTVVDFRLSESSSDEWQKDFLANSDYQPTSTILSGNKTIQNENRSNYTFKVDYIKPLKYKNDTSLSPTFGDDHKFEAGIQARISDQNSDYLFYNYNSDSSDFIFKDDYSSTMNYVQNIYSAYATYGGLWKNKYGYLFGLRGELTDRNITDHGVSHPFEQFDIFPTIHLSRKFVKDQQVLLSYSRRIERPNGWNLDPFPRFMSTYFIRVGNPDLKPEYYNNFELSYQIPFKNNSSFSLEAYYRQTQNKITQYRQVDSLYSYMLVDNLDQDQAAGIEASLMLNLFKTLSWNLSGSTYYYQLDGAVNDSAVSKSSNNYNLKTNLTWRFLPNGRIQFNVNYDGPSVTAQGTSKPMTFSNLSIRYDFFKKKLGVTFTVRDLFNTSKHEMESWGENFYSYNVFRRQGRMLNLTLQYKINNYKQDNRRSSSMGGDEGGGMEF